MNERVRQEAWLHNFTFYDLSTSIDFGEYAYRGGDAIHLSVDTMNKICTTIGKWTEQVKKHYADEVPNYLRERYISK